MARYKLVRKKNRLNPAKDGFWHAIPAPGFRMDAKELCEWATSGTTLSDTELRMGLEMVLKQLPRWLAAGYIVELGELGSFKLEYGSEGVPEPEDFNTDLIRQARVVFRPAKKLGKEIRQKLRFRAAGLIDQGVSFTSVKDYREWLKQQEEKEAEKKEEEAQKE